MDLSRVGLPANPPAGRTPLEAPTSYISIPEGHPNDRVINISGFNPITVTGNPKVPREQLEAVTRHIADFINRANGRIPLLAETLMAQNRIILSPWDDKEFSVSQGISPEDAESFSAHFATYNGVNFDDKIIFNFRTTPNPLDYTRPHIPEETHGLPYYSTNETGHIIFHELMHASNYFIRDFIVNDLNREFSGKTFATSQEFCESLKTFINSRTYLNPEYKEMITSQIKTDNIEKFLTSNSLNFSQIGKLDIKLITIILKMIFNRSTPDITSLDQLFLNISMPYLNTCLQTLIDLPTEAKPISFYFNKQLQAFRENLELCQKSETDPSVSPEDKAKLWEKSGSLRGTLEAELVAEVGVGLLMGKTYPPEIMRYYALWFGPEIH